MKNKNKSITFNTEEQYEFYTTRLSTCMSSEERLKGQQMQNYQKTSILYNPIDVEYTVEELKEKLEKVKEIEKSIMELINDKEEG